MINEKRTVIIRDVELHWANLNPENPKAPFGTMQWDVQNRTRDKTAAKEMQEKYYLTMKKEEDEQGDYWKANIKRKAIKNDGGKNTPPDVVDGNKQSINGNSIGNGSVGNVMLFQYPYDVAGRKGVASMLSKVQVVDLKLYQPDSGTDFEIVEGSAAPAGDSAVDF
jgi:hypothetical protein